MKNNYLFSIILITVVHFSNAQQLIEAIPLGFVPKSSVDAELAAFGETAISDVIITKILYETIGSDGQLDTASGLLAYPDVDFAMFPMIAYQHGTTDGKEDCPSNLQAGSGEAIGFAGLGNVAVAADYIGMGESRGFHPYINAETEARAGVHMIQASQSFCAQNGIALTEELFVTGYSQGGQGAMALHRDIQHNYQGVLEVTASAPMSGPYDLSGVSLDNFLSDEVYFFAAYIPYIIIGNQQIYGDLYNNLVDVFKPQYATIIEGFLEEDYSVFAINQNLIFRLILDFGFARPKNMLQDSVLNNLINDPDFWMRNVLSDNNTYDWIPDAPMRLFYCEADDQVIYLNSIVADSVMNANGAQDVKAISQGANFDHGQCAPPAFSAAIDFFRSFLPTGITEWSPNMVKITPNPASDHLQLDLGDEIDLATVTLYNLTGQKMLERKIFPGQTIGVNQLDQGTYFITASTETGNYRSKVVIQR